MQCGCAICQDRFDSAVGIATTECGHVFHLACLEKWIKRSCTCPECRSRVFKNTITKLFFNFSLDSTSDNNFDRSLDELKEQLRVKDLECSDKDKKIRDLRMHCARSEEKAEKMHQEQMQLENEVSKVKREIQKLHQVEANNQKLLLRNGSLESELEHLNNVKTIVEGCSSDAEKILRDQCTFNSTAEGRIATNKIATYCSVIKRELTRSREEKTQLQNELIQVKRKMGILQAESSKKIRLMGKKIRSLEEHNKSFEDPSSISFTVPVKITPGAVSASSSSNHLGNSETIGSPDSSSKCEENVTPIAVDLPGNKRLKLNIVVIDKEVPKMSAEAPATPVLKNQAYTILHARSKIIPHSKDEDSVSRTGYNGLGGHGCVIHGSKIK